MMATQTYVTAVDVDDARARIAELRAIIADFDAAIAAREPGLAPLELACSELDEIHRRLVNDLGDVLKSARQEVGATFPANGDVERMRIERSEALAELHPKYQALQSELAAIGERLQEARVRRTEASRRLADLKRARQVHQARLDKLLIEEARLSARRAGQAEADRSLLERIRARILG